MSNGVDFRKMAVDLRGQLTAAQSDLAALREELASVTADRDQLKGIASAYIASDGEKDLRICATEQRLTAAEQRNAELEKDAARWNFFSSVANELQAFPHSWGMMTPEKMNHMCDEAMTAALKPTESGASE